MHDANRPARGALRALAPVLIPVLARIVLAWLFAPVSAPVGGTARRPIGEPHVSESDDSRANGSAGARPESARPRATRSRTRRLATSVCFVVLFFAGAALSALGGDILVGATSDEPAGAEAACGDPSQTGTQATQTTGSDCSTTGEPSTGSAPETTDATPTETTPAETSPGDGQPPPPPDDPAPTGASPGDGEQPPPADPAPVAPQPDPGDQTEAAPPAPDSPNPDVAPASPDDGTDESVVLGPPRPRSEPAPSLDPEGSSAAAATIWLHRTLPDPTPPAKRLSREFARQLKSVARANRVSWTLVLGVLRAQGHQGRVPAGTRKLRSLAGRLSALGAGKNPWAAVLAFSGRTAFADRAVALARYNRAVRLRALVTGLEAATPSLIARVLADRRIQIYPGGRSDALAGRVDVRVLVLLRYLRLAHRSVTVSSLVSGHRLFARPGIVSAHVYGFAVDVSVLGGVPITGHQQPGGLTERAVRSILLLPVELRPQQVISLLGFGGPSFPLPDHYDHIHVGY